MNLLNPEKLRVLAITYSGIKLDIIKKIGDFELLESLALSMLFSPEVEKIFVRNTLEKLKSLKELYLTKSYLA